MTTQDKGHTAVGIIGIALVVGFFMPWLDVGSFFKGLSGWDVVSSSQFAWTTRILLCGIPVGGILMALSGFGGSRGATALSALVGVGILGYFFFAFAWSFMKTTGVGLWMVLGGSIAAIAIGAAGGSKKS